MAAAGAWLRRELALDVEEARSGDVPPVVERPARLGVSELPAAVDELVAHRAILACRVGVTTAPFRGVCGASTERRNDHEADLHRRRPRDRARDRRAPRRSRRARARARRIGAW